MRKNKIRITIFLQKLAKIGLSFFIMGKLENVRLSRIPPVSKAYMRFAFFLLFSTFGTGSAEWEVEIEYSNLRYI